ncbi:MAG TPA: Gfo/Idh/MocA family oxidoreductase [Verrucomicrobiales bacterium]|jgi:predicted dehydrogenase|nr:Gfo/Idh/MocA family oxidoreductase [Verrucomicrobiales bacterium]
MESNTTPEASRPATSRRKFIGGAAVAAAAVNLPIEACAQVAGSDELKLAIVGCGGRGGGAINQALTSGGTRLVAMADAYQSRLEPLLSSMQSKFSTRVDVPESRRYIGLESYKDVLEHANVVLLTTPPGFRPMMFKAAIDAGKHVFMEKPVAVDSPGARLVMEYAKKADEKGLKVVVGLQRRYQTAYLEAYKKVKEEGLIGDIVAAQCYWNGGGVWEPFERKPGMSEMEYQVKNWYYYTWLSGDHIDEQHIHNIDVINWFMGDKHPVAAQGMGGRQVRVDKKYGQIFDHHYVEYAYDNGVIMNSQCRHQKNCWSSVSEMIIGDKGTLYLDRAVIKDKAGKTIWQHRNRDDMDPYQVEHNRLYAAIRENKPLNNASYGAQSTFTAILGRYATYGGKMVKWDEALAWNNSEMPAKLGFDQPSLVQPNPDGSYKVPIPGEFDPSKPLG